MNAFMILRSLTVQHPPGPSIEEEQAADQKGQVRQVGRLGRVEHVG
jgi:hypothetical protein